MLSHLGKSQVGGGVVELSWQERSVRLEDFFDISAKMANYSATEPGYSCRPRIDLMALTVILGTDIPRLRTVAIRGHSREDQFVQTSRSTATQSDQPAVC